jgi:hypothetical protein
MISSSLRDHDEGFEELLSELVDARVDTIELFVGCDDATTAPRTSRISKGWYATPSG